MAGYYSYIDPDPAVARGFVYLLDAIDAYTFKGRLADAEKLRAIYAELVRGYTALGPEMAIRADELIVGRIRSTAVRPPTSGRLEAAIHSIPQPNRFAAFPGGGVDIASFDELDKKARNPRDKATYWRSQEYGLPVIPGQRPAPGYFMPGYSAPNPSEFRVHPYFEQMPYAKGMPALVRNRPLEARYFLRDGSKLAAAEWERRSAKLYTRAEARLALV